mgnify:CR=1 FL=1
MKYVVPYLPHRYITTNSRPKTGSITFIGSVRLSHVRQRVLTLQNISGTYIRQAGTGTYGYTGNHHTSQKAIDYANVMMNSTFCFALPGGTITARRVYDAILAGCIPVIVTGFDDTEKHNTTDVESQKYRKWETLRNLAFTVCDDLVFASRECRQSTQLFCCFKLRRTPSRGTISPSSLTNNDGCAMPKVWWNSYKN